MTPARSTVQFDVLKRTGGRVEDLEDLIAVEEPMAIKVHRVRDSREIAHSLNVTMRTPGNDFELAAGWLFTEGLVRCRADIQRIEHCADVHNEEQGNVVSVHLRPGLCFDETAFTRHFYTTSACGVCGKATLEQVRVRGFESLAENQFSIDAARLLDLPARLLPAQRVFRQTGGIHAAGLFEADGRLLALREDVGRHNAVDKLIGGYWLWDEVPLDKYLMLVSGRASFEILQKAVAAGIPLVAAVGAPSSLAVALAREYGLTLIGFLNKKGFNVYTGAVRVRGG